MMSYEAGNSSSFYVDGGEKEKSIKSMMDFYYQKSYTPNSAYWQEGLIDKRFKVGDQSLFSAIYGEQDANRNRRFFFNLIRKHVSMISGYQRRNRKSPSTQSLDAFHDDLSDQYTRSLFHIDRQCNFQDLYSQGCEASLDVGISWMHQYLDYSRDPIGGDIAWDQVAYNNCLVDPFFRKADMSDCNFWWRRRWVSKEIAKTLMPSRAKEIERIAAKNTGDGRFPLQAEMVGYNTTGLLPYDEFYYLSDRPATMVTDRQTGEVSEWRWSKEELDQIKQPWMIVSKERKSTVRMAVCIGNKVLYDGPTLTGIDSYPVVPIFCYYEPDVNRYAWRIQGVVRNMRDAQYLYNRRKIIELDILESQANSGWIFKNGAVTDVKAFRQKGQGLLIPLTQNAEMGDVQRIEPPAVPQSMIELSRALAEDITQISGVNEELLGSAVDDKAGILAVLRQGAGLTTLEGIFDRWDTAQKLCSRKNLEAAQLNWTYGKARRILGEEPHARFFDRDINRYEIIVTPGVYSTSQRQMEAQQLIYLRNEMQMPIPDRTIINALPIQNKDQLIRDIEQQQQEQAQAQAQAQQAQMMQAQAQAEKTAADTAAQQALAQERQAKVMQSGANMALQLSRANKEEASADLDLVRQIVELDNLGFESIARSFEIAQRIRREADENKVNEYPNPGEIYG